MRIQLFLLLFFSFSLCSQDAYHLGLLENLKNNHGLEGGAFLFANTEAQLFSNGYQYGSMQVTDQAVANMDFSMSKSIVVSAVGTNAWDAGMGQETSISISEGDLVLVTFWARKNSADSQIFVFAENSTTFDKEFYLSLSLTPDWNQYFLAFSSSAAYNVGRLKAGFHLASAVQDIEIAGFTAINYEDKYGIGDLPTSFSPFNYEGIEDDAPWRAIAESRIETLRKSDLTVVVQDKNGNPVNDARVEVEMQKHAFGFGSAVVTCRVPGNNCYDPNYVNKLLDLDGKGHRFNECVNENALKWRAWENNWLGTPEETVAAFQWFTDNGITMRGHNIIWPGSDFLPDDINNNLTDLDYLRTKIDARIEEMISHPELSKIVRDWDVLNEITTNRTLENAFNSDPAFESGREIYGEIFRKVRDLDPELELYINDYMVISSGSASQIARYKSFLDELLEDEVPFDGIGFQCHIGSVPNSIPQVEQHFNDFYQRYGKRMKVTEYDINNAVDESIQEKYMRDLLTLTFSHPGMDAFIMWGFWDGNHWKQNAPMFYEDWTLKPSGEMFIQKVYNDWWTVENTQSNTLGLADFRPFKGEHLIRVSKDGISTEEMISLSDNKEVIITLGDSNATSELDSMDFLVSPNPVTNGMISLSFPTEYSKVKVKLLDLNGRLVQNLGQIKSGQNIKMDANSGTYNLQLEIGSSSVLKKLIIL